MNSSRLTILTLVALVLLSGCSAIPKVPAAARATDDVFSRFLALNGAWTANFEFPEEGGTGKMPPSKVTYHTIANGSAVVETLFAGTPYEMITVFFRDGERLLMTHYCAARNQPNLFASEITEDSVSFVTDYVTNLSGPNAMYMGEAVWFFTDENNIRTQWWSFENGERSEPSTTFNLTRTIE